MISIGSTATTSIMQPIFQIKTMKIYLSTLLLLLIFSVSSSGEYNGYEKYQRFDGWYNNLEHPDWGRKDTQLIRRTPADYQDDVYMIAGQNRPSARKLSNLFMKGKDFQALPSSTNKTALFAFFGQVVAMEILMSTENGCPIELRKIDVDKCDPTFDAKCEGNKYIPFLRAAYDPKTGKNPNSPRKLINKVTSWIDGSFIYSNNANWAHAMRTHENGTLRMDPSGKLPVQNDVQMPIFNKDIANSHLKLDPKRLFLLGDARSNQNLPVLVFGILFHRWHNFVANEIKNENPTMSDYELFHKARKFVIATLQNVIMYEYLPALLGEPMPKYSGYDFDLHPGISPIFQSAAFRFGHSMIPPGIFVRNNECIYRYSKSGRMAVRLCNTWWDASEAMKGMLTEEIIMGMTSQLAEREDHLLSEELRDHLFGPLEFTARDLAALNIMRGRDNGLPDYNTARKAFGLKPRKSWNEINPKLFRHNPEFLRTLMETHSNDLNNVDVYVGGMLESSDGPGELFKTIIKEQFLRLRDADRFWFENDKNGQFSKAEIEKIKKITLWDIIVNATDIEPDDIQRDVFTWHHADPCPQPFQLGTAILEPCAPLQQHDYFQNSKFAYTYVCALIFFLPILCASAGYGVIKLQNRKRRQMTVPQKPTNQSFDGNVNVDKIELSEWLHHNYRRSAKVQFNDDSSLTLHSRKGEVLRKFRFKSPTETYMVKIEQSNGNNKPARGIVLLHTDFDYDLVLELDSFVSQGTFMTYLLSFLKQHDVIYETLLKDPDDILKEAETYEARQEKLDQFFRAAYDRSIGKDSGNSPPLQKDQKSALVEIRLSINEFARALGMKPDEFFVTHMFRAIKVDQDGDDKISFKEFSETVAKFGMNSSPENKMKNMFKLFGGRNTNSYIQKNDFSDIMRSLLNMACTTSLSPEKVTEIIDSFFWRLGLQEKNQLSFEDFKLIMNEYKKDWSTVGLDLKGTSCNIFIDTKNSTVPTHGAEHVVPDTPKDGRNFVRKFLEKQWNFLAEARNNIVAYIGENKQQAFYFIVFYVFTFGFFYNNFYYYSFMAEHTDLRHVMGVGIAITRGAAASLSFCYSLLLLTMCRNTLAKLKEYPIHQYLPIDSHVPFHKVVGCTAVFFSLVHSIGHLVNFYHISTQPLEHLRCLTPQIHFSSEDRPDITYWLFRTIPGVTGILLFIITTIIFVFSYQPIRERAYKYFWRTHLLYVALYILCLIHGIGGLTASPSFWIFFIGPGSLFIFDKLLSLRTMSQSLQIIDTEILPSDVVMIKFCRPPNLKYLSGQWIRLACKDFNRQEYHAFTLTSAPHENFLSCHIKARGPWTWKLRDYFDTYNFRIEDGEKRYVSIEGPFSGGNQDWYKFEVAVLIGGGIGVTPYASILKDLIYNSSSTRYTGFACKKVYFIWVCSSHKHFEWFIDLLRDLEMVEESRRNEDGGEGREERREEDYKGLLDVHIFITQFFHKFDLRTAMLYMCEEHLIRVSGRSIFTGLRAKNHFGRPNLPAFLRYVRNKHSNLDEIGVFSCGPEPLTKSVTSACEEVNKMSNSPWFVHHYENFG